MDAIWKNPYVAGSPIRGTEMFFGREDIFEWLRRHLIGQFQDNAIVLHGERRTGKTSVLYQVMRRLNDPTYIPVFIDAQQLSLDSMVSFLWQLATKIWGGIRRLEGAEHLERPRQEEYVEAPGVHFAEVFLGQVQEVIGTRKLLVLFDEFGRLRTKVEAGDLPVEIFYYLRSLMADHRLTIVFSIGSKIEEMGAEYATLFNQAIYHQITFLSDADARPLITEPVAAYYGYQPEAIDLILKATSGHPFYIQHLCHSIFAYREKGDTQPVSVDEVEQALPNVVEATAQNLKFVWDDVGPVEQVILAALATLVVMVGGGVSLSAVRQMLANADASPPLGRISVAMQTLRSRDAIVEGMPGEYKFAVEPLRIWISKERRLDFVRQQLVESGVLSGWQRDDQPIPRRSWWQQPIVIGGATIAVMLLMGSLWFVFGDELNGNSEPSTQESNQVAVVSVSPTQTPTETATPTNTPDLEETFTARLAARDARATETAATAIAFATQNAPTPTETPTPTSTSTATPVPSPTPTVTNTSVPSPTPTATPVPALSLETLRGKIIFATNRSGFSTEIYQMNPDGSEARSLGEAGFELYQQAASREAISHDGQEIIEVRVDGQPELWRHNLVNGNELRVTSNPASDFDPAWSPIDNWLLFASDRTGQTDIYRLNLDLPGDVGERLTLAGEFDKHASWSPDAKKVVYWSGTDQQRQIWVLDLETKQPVNISNNPFRDWDPIWVK